MSQKIIDSLKALGLTENEADIYLALVKFSPCFVAPLVQETRKHRQMVYNALETLLKQNLITRSIKNGKQLYELSDPSRLMGIVREQEIIAQNVIDTIQEQVQSSAEQVEALRGINGYKIAINGLLQEAEKYDEYLVLNSITHEFLEITAPFQKDFLKRLRAVKANGGRVKVLAYGNEVAAMQSASLGKQFYSDPFETRILSGIQPPQTTWISGNSVYLRNRLADPLIVHTKSQDLSSRYKQYFSELWEQAKILS